MRARFAGILALGLTAACGSQSTTPSAVADAVHLPADQVIYGLRHNMTKEGIRTGVLTGDTAYVYESERRLDLRGVRLQFFNDSGRETGTLTSKTGDYNISTGAFVARDDVVLITEGPEGSRRLETEELHYDVQGDQLWSDMAFQLTENGRTTRGTSFRSDSRFRTWSVTNARTEGGLPQSGGGISF